MSWLKDENFYIVIMVLLVVIMALRTPVDSDMWWHLRAGQETSDSGKPYLTDTLSYTRLGSDWVNHSWLSQWVMYLVYSTAGYRGLALWVALAAAASLVFTYFQSEGQALLKVFAVILAGVVSSPVWTPRPQIHSLVLFSAVGYLLYLFKNRGKNYLFITAPIMILWSNLHGGYVLGLILMGCFLGGGIINNLLIKRNQPERDWAAVRQLVLWTVISVLAVIINPNGLDMWRIPFQTVGVDTLQNYIEEWASPDFHQLLQQSFLILFFAVFGAVGFSRLRLDGVEFLSVALFGSAALVARRNFGPFAIAATPVLTRHASDLVRNLAQQIKDQEGFIGNILKDKTQNSSDLNPRIRTSVNLLTVLVMTIGAGYKWIKVSDPQLVERAEGQMFPVDAVDWIKENQPEGRMLNAYNWGGYLTWHLRDYPVFVDGRTDLFGDDVIKDYIIVAGSDSDWKSVIDRWNVKFLLLENNPLLVDAYLYSGWKISYKNNQSVVLTR